MYKPFVIICTLRQRFEKLNTIIFKSSGGHCKTPTTFNNTEREKRRGFQMGEITIMLTLTIIMLEIHYTASGKA